MEFAVNKRIVQRVFKSQYQQLQQMKLSVRERKAVDAIVSCRTPANGFQYLSCPNGHGGTIVAHSCRHRSCVLCADKARHEWVEAQKERLLNCPHYHVIFTLPHEYNVLWQYNRKWFTQAFFRACHEALAQLLSDPRHLGATPGILMNLHTWGRQLSQHPHMHCLVTAGGLRDNGKWVASKHEYLLPIRALKVLYRGKLQAFIKEALGRGELRLAPDINLSVLMGLHQDLYKKQWSVRIQSQYHHGRGVMLYLARYVKGGPFNPLQSIRCDQEQISFRYKDHRDQRVKPLHLSTVEFIRRLLWHVPEPGSHVVRHYGIYASQAHDKRDRCRALLGELPQKSRLRGNQAAVARTKTVCAQCGAALRLEYTVNKWERNENSYRGDRWQGFVQQVVRADLDIAAASGSQCFVGT